MVLGLERVSYFSADTHWVNLMLLNRPGLLARVLCVIAHHDANIESVRVDRLDGSDRSSAVLKISIPTRAWTAWSAGCRGSSEFCQSMS